MSDFITSYKDLIIKTTGVDLFPPGGIWNSWNYEKDNGYTNKQLDKVWTAIKGSEEFWELLPAYPDTKEIILQLYGRVLKGDDVYFITTRPSNNNPSAKHQTEHWLMDQTIGHLDMWADFYPTVIVTDDKGPVAKALDLTHFIDDKWENCCAVYEAATECEIYLLDRPWNYSTNAPSIKRVNSVLDMLKEMD